jgi:protein TonB
MRKNEQGVVIVEADLDENARILRSRVSQSSGFERLDTATKTAIDKCRFRAATSDGLPQASTAVVRFTWALQGK